MLVINVIDPYRKEVHVIHYSTPGSKKGVKIVEQNNMVLEEYVNITEIIERVTYKGNVALPVPERISRARSRLSETKYNIFTNNCESFVNWAVTGWNVTDQGQRCQYL